MQAFSSVVVGVSDLGKSLDLWTRQMGLELRSRRHGPDHELARLWNMQADDIVDQALLGTPGSLHGQLHLVQYASPLPPVRLGATPVDHCPKNLDVFVDEMGTRHANLLKFGNRFRSTSWSEVITPAGDEVSEIQMLGDDCVNIVLLQMNGAVQNFTCEGFAAVGPLVLAVGNQAEEIGFFRDTLQLDLLNEITTGGEALERAIGLPAGTEVSFTILGSDQEPLGRIEIIAYCGVEGRDLYPNAIPGALGITQVFYQTNNCDSLLQHLKEQHIEYVDYGRLGTLSTAGRTISLTTPSGFRVDVVQPLNAS